MQPSFVPNATDDDDGWCVPVPGYGVVGRGAVSVAGPYGRTRTKQMDPTTSIPIMRGPCKARVLWKLSSTPPASFSLPSFCKKIENFSQFWGGENREFPLVFVNPDPDSEGPRWFSALQSLKFPKRDCFHCIDSDPDPDQRKIIIIITTTTTN